MPPFSHRNCNSLPSLITNPQLEDKRSLNFPTGLNLGNIRKAASGISGYFSFQSSNCDSLEPVLPSEYRRSCYYYSKEPFQPYTEPILAYADHQPSGGVKSRCVGCQGGAYQKRIYQKKQNGWWNGLTFNELYSLRQQGRCKRLYASGSISSNSNSGRSERAGDKVRRRFRKAKSDCSLSAVNKMEKKKFVLGEKDIRRIEIMNSGLSIKRIYVCECLANLYFDDADSLVHRFLGCSSISSSTSTSTTNSSDSTGSKWRRIATGVPLLMLKTETIRHASYFTKRQSVLIRLAELETGFKLWEQEINPKLSKYKTISKHQRTFHKFAYQSHQRRRVGLSFDCSIAAEKFYENLCEFSREAESYFTVDEICEISKSSKQLSASLLSLLTSSRSTRRNPKSIDYSDWDIPMPSLRPEYDSNAESKNISKPCFFRHVNSMNQQKAENALKTVSFFKSRSTSAFPFGNYWL